MNRRSSSLTTSLTLAVAASLGFASELPAVVSSNPNGVSVEVETQGGVTEAGPVDTTVDETMEK